MRLGIAVNTENCMACYNCSMACKDEHCGFGSAISAPQPHEGQFWVNIQSRERGDDTRKVKTINVPVICGTLETPEFEKAIAEGTMVKRPDGITYIDPEKSKGHMELVKASPYGGIFWNEELQIAQKCTMCAELLDKPGYKNAQPRCVEACPNEAIAFGDLDDPESEVSKIIAANKVTPLPGAEGIKTNVVYLNLPTVFLAGSVYLPGDETGEDPADGAKITLTNKATGEKLEVTTNYFGDWEKEELTIGAEYDISIEMPGYKTAALSALADTDHYVGEIILEKE